MLTNLGLLGFAFDVILSTAHVVWCCKNTSASFLYPNRTPLRNCRSHKHTRRETWWGEDALLFSSLVFFEISRIFSVPRVVSQPLLGGFVYPCIYLIICQFNWIEFVLESQNFLFIDHPSVFFRVLDTHWGSEKKFWTLWWFFQSYRFTPSLISILELRKQDTEIVG